MRKRRLLIGIAAVLLVCLAGIGIARGCRWAEGVYREATFYDRERTQAEYAVKAFAEANDIFYGDYPQSLIELLERNPETEAFVLEYPIEHGKKHEIDLSEYEDSERVPLFMQWDQRWGYIHYGSDVAGLTACGPVCLSMAAYYLTGDETMSPDNMIYFSLRNGYCVPGNGTAWALISEGGEKLGLDVTELPLDEDRILAELEAGNPIICVMGPGDFTTTGHYIVLADCEDGMLRINDPNSYANSEQLWEFDRIKDQIRNLWVIRSGE